MTEPAGDLAAFYEAGYTQEDPARAEQLGRWRALGARSKALHVVELCRRGDLRPGTLVEIGCGDGSLLEALSRRGVAAAYDGFELSEPAARIAAGRQIAGAGRIEAYDGATVPVADGTYDLAVLSHVLEHVREPRTLLAEAGRVARHVVVEVPLEDNRSGRRPGKVEQSRAIGHIQCFSREAVRDLAAACSLSIVADLGDPLPRAHHAFFAASAGERTRAAAKWALRSALWRAAPRRAERLFTVHYACLLARDGPAVR